MRVPEERKLGACFFSAVLKRDMSAFDVLAVPVRDIKRVPAEVERMLLRNVAVAVAVAANHTDRNTLKPLGECFRVGSVVAEVYYPIGTFNVGYTLY